MSPHEHSTVAKWREAAEDLGFTLIAPFTLEERSETLTYLACLPQFGSARGMLVITDSSLETQSRLSRAAAAHGFGYSCMSASAEPYDRDVMIAVLTDWGWTSSDPAPAWCSDSHDPTQEA
jgi:hypothetical protein